MLIDMQKQMKPGRVYRLHLPPDRWTQPMLCNFVTLHSKYLRSYFMSNRVKGSFHNEGCYYWQRHVISTSDYTRIITWKLCWFRTAVHVVKRTLLSRRTVKSAVSWFQTKWRKL